MGSIETPVAALDEIGFKIFQRLDEQLERFERRGSLGGWRVEQNGAPAECQRTEAGEDR